MPEAEGRFDRIRVDNPGQIGRLASPMLDRTCNRECGNGAVRSRQSGLGKIAVQNGLERVEIAAWVASRLDDRNARARDLSEAEPSLGTADIADQYAHLSVPGSPSRRPDVLHAATPLRCRGS